MCDRLYAEAFHDFILAQGLPPPEALAQTVHEDFIGGQAFVVDIANER